MASDLSNQVLLTQASMVEAGRASFTDQELDALRCLTRLTVEFFHYLQRLTTDSPNEAETRYVAESVFSGVDSFCTVSTAYRVMSDETKSFIAWGEASIGSLSSEFRSKYQEFLVETNFEKRCRLLLDLFKLQIVFAGVFYN